jgi:hypothetical protein
MMKRNSIKQCDKKITKRVIGFFIIFTLLGISIINQWNYNIVPFVKHRKRIMHELSLTDIERRNSSLGKLARVIETIKQSPEIKTLYFVPVFSGKPGMMEDLRWWLTNIMLRFFCYPKKVLSIQYQFYNNDKELFYKMYIKGEKEYSSLDWVKSRGITHLIIYKNDKISIVPVTAPIDS